MPTPQKSYPKRYLRQFLLAIFQIAFFGLIFAPLQSSLASSLPYCKGPNYEVIIDLSIQVVQPQRRELQKSTGFRIFIKVSLDNK